MWKGGKRRKWCVKRKLNIQFLANNGTLLFLNECSSMTGTCYLGFHTNAFAHMIKIVLFTCQDIITLCPGMPKIQLNSVQMCQCQWASEAHSFRKTFIISSHWKFFQFLWFSVGTNVNSVPFLNKRVALQLATYRSIFVSKFHLEQLSI